MDSSAMLFQGKYEAKLDSKGRVSVPARFRAVLGAEARGNVYCFQPVPHEPCVLNAGGGKLHEQIDNTLARIDPFSQDYKDLANAYYGNGEELPLDAQGRILLPPKLREHLDVSEQILFVGMGFMFHIWQPEAYAVYNMEAASRAAEAQTRLSEERQRVG